MTDSLKIAGIIRESIVDGPGIRFAVFCQGCPHNCPGCHNPETHDFAAGSDVTIDNIVEEFDMNPLLAGITFSGGEPFCQAEGFVKLGQRIKERGKSITIFTGYTLEELVSKAKSDKAIAELLMMCDILIDGPFVEAEKDLTLQFRGSANQRVIDMKRTWKEGQVILYGE